MQITKYIRRQFHSYKSFLYCREIKCVCSIMHCKQRLLVAQGVSIKVSETCQNLCYIFVGEIYNEILTNFLISE